MKNILIIGLIGLSLASVGYNLKQGIDNNRSQKRLAQLEQATTGGQARIIDHYIHDSIAHVVIREVPAKTAEEKRMAVGSGLVDTVTEALRVAVNRVDEVTQINAALQAENLHLKQAQNPALQTYGDKWLHLTYNRDSNTANVTYAVSLNQARYWKRSWLIGPKHYYDDFFSDDPRVTVNSVRRFTVPAPKQKRFGAGASLGYTYMPGAGGWRPYLGLGLNYNLVAF